LYAAITEGTTMERASSKHGPQRDDELEREDREITHTGEPQPGPEWRQTEPFNEPQTTPEEQMVGTPAGMTPSGVNERADIAVYVQPHKLPADRAAILENARQEGAPDEVMDALGRLEGRTVYHTIGEIVRAIGIHTEEPRDRTDG
jgi:Protein of unknown function (DUF2795)